MNTRKYVDGRLVSGGVPPHLDVSSEPYDGEEPVKATLPVKSEQRPVVPIKITDTAGLRGFLITQMQLAAQGKIDTETVKNVCALTQQIYQATKLELEAARLLADGTKSIRTIELTEDD